MDCTRSFPGFFLVVSGLLLTQPVTANSQQIGESESDFVLEKGRVGRLKVGHQADDVIAMFGRDNTRIVNLNYEGMFTPALEIRLRGKEGPVGLIAEISGGCRGFMVGRIQVFDSRYRTPEGIGVGSTVRDAASHYWLRYTLEEGAKLLADPVSMIFYSSGDLQDESTVLERVLVRLPWAEYREVCSGSVP